MERGMPRLRHQPDRLRVAVRLLTLILTVCAVAAPTTRAADPAPTPDFPTQIRPILQQHCFKCHGPDKKKADVDFSTIADEKSASKNRRLWRNALEQVSTLEMPPPGKEPPIPAPQRDALLAWMKHVATTFDCSDPADRDPGPALIRRLTRPEYNLTIRDLVGLDFDAGQAVGMPEDLPTHGYSNGVNGLILPPALMEKYFAATDQILDKLYAGAPASLATSKLPTEKRNALKRAYESVFGAPAAPSASADNARPLPSPGIHPGETAQDARRILERFATRAYRRPIRPEELTRLTDLFARNQSAGQPFAAALRLPLKAILVSPNFLFRIEEDHPAPTRSNTGTGTGYRVSDHELATRLSYFLWSSMPDDELFRLAAENKLSDPATLEQQTRRMLADPKAKALTDQFAAQWLQLTRLETARPSTEFFPTFKPALRQAMFDETATFFDHLRTDDRPVTDLLDADYTFVNADLAKHYDLPSVTGKELRKVPLPPSLHRGGLLGMASVLALTSQTSRTSPTLRGKYVLEVLLGTPPPPPPPDAGQLKDDKKKGAEPKTFREQMAQHAANPSCASCHKRIDPLGYALENYDAVGRYRDTAGGNRPLDNTGELPTGEKFTGPAELKQVLLQRTPQFTRNMSEQLLSYALGRDLDDYDECTTKEITDRLTRENHRFSSLVLGIVQSYPFQHRKNAESKE
jgi:mono/diheme cytochrome c family protein